MSITGHDSLKTRRTLDVNGKSYDYFSLEEAGKQLGDVSALPYSMKVLLENLLRYEDGRTVSWPQALLRFTLGILTFGIGLLWIGFSPKQQALYDLLARTRMITVEAKHIPQMPRH